MPNKHRRRKILGVSLTGIMDNSIINRRRERLPEILQSMRNKAVVTNKEWAEKLGIPQSKLLRVLNLQVQLVNLLIVLVVFTRHNPYYIRTVRGDNKDPLTEFMKAQYTK